MGKDPPGVKEDEIKDAQRTGLVARPTGGHPLESLPRKRQHSLAASAAPTAIVSVCKGDTTNSPQ
jgi:hypothetical protein